MRKKPIKILVIPDSHANPDFDNKRYYDLGKFANKVKPTHIVSMGDWAEMYSLGRFDVGSVKAEGARYQDDIDAANDALNEFDKSYKGKATKIFLLGNHEHRISIAANKQPALYGKLKTDDIQAAEYGWQVVPFLDYATIAGVHFIHYVPSKNGKALSGVNLARKIVMKVGSSVVVGHTHTAQFDYEVDNVKGTKRYGLVSGYYGHPDYAKSRKSSWATGGKEYWHGNVCVLDNVYNGEYSLSIIRSEEVK